MAADGGGAAVEDIREAVRAAYSAAIEGREAGCCTDPDAVTDMTQGNYRAADLAGTGEAAEQSFGCGDPVRAALLKPGERVLDLGCGAGLDLILAARDVGPSGHVYGLDMTPAMLARARKNVAKLGLRNVTLLKGHIETLPLFDGGADVLISNCVINLSPDKGAVFDEAFRVLAPGGRFCVSDVVLLRPVPEMLRRSTTVWSG